MTYSRRQLEAFGEPFGESATKIKPGGRIYGGGGAPSTPTEVTQRTVGYSPEYEPIVREAIDRAVYEASKPYESYKGDRFASFDPLQLQAQQSIANLGPSQQLGTATQMAGLAGLRAGQMQYDPSQFVANTVSSGFAPSQFTANQVGSTYSPTGVQAERAATSYTPTNIVAERITGGGYKAGEFTPDQVASQKLQYFQMTPAERVAAERTFTEAFNRPGTAESYMSPYMQNVVDIQRREAQRQEDIARTRRGAAAVGAGAFGGSAQAILEAEAARNYAQLQNDIQAKGSQAAFEQAAQQFTADQARMLQSQLANQQTGLQAALANQAMGLTVGRENLAAKLGVQQLESSQQMQAALANQQAKLEAQRQREQAAQFAAQQEMQMQLANQQAEMEATKMREQQAQFGGVQGLQAALANQQAMLEAAKVREQAAQFGGAQGLQAALANQQAAMEAQRQGEASRQFGAGQTMQADLANQQAVLEAQRLAEQSRQYGAGLDLQGLQQQLAAASQLGALGQTQFAQQQAIINAQATAGGQRQALEQQKLNQAYEDFLAQKQNPYQQIAFIQEMLKGTPQQTTQSIYAAPPSLTSQLAGAGSIYAGGKMAGYFAKGGLTTLALHNMMK